MNKFSNIYTQRLENFYKELEEVCGQVHRDPSSVDVVFATKYLGPEEWVRFLGDVRGVGDLRERKILIGENRVQAAEEKMKYLMEHAPELRETFCYILIGNLQTNKINKAIEIFDEIHAVDSVELAVALDKRLCARGKHMNVFLEINVSGEETKQGFEVDEVMGGLGELTRLRQGYGGHGGILVQGLMTMAPFVENPEETRVVFRELRMMANEYMLKTSMGMSNDWTVAIEEGSDMIRVGSTIFG